MLIQISEPNKNNETLKQFKSIKKDIAIGIDLGTTNSLVAYCDKNSNTKILPDKKGNFLEPSSVLYSNKGKIYVGYEAVNNPLALHSIKRLIGKNITLTSKEHKSLNNINKDNLTINPIRISAEILKSLKKRAEKALGKQINKAVITVPAYFDEQARLATRKSAELAKLKVLRLINEPTAAAYAYGLHTNSKGIYAFYDLGGGTFDFTLLKLHQGIFQVLATGGDTKLGGNDIDTKILNTTLNKKNINKISLRDTRYLKEKLSYNKQILFQQNYINRYELEQSSFSLIRKTFRVCQNVCKDAKIKINDIKGIVLVGGATQMPLIRKSINIFFNKKAITKYNPNEIVALGAAIQARSLTKENNSLLLDVTPLSLGIETMGCNVERLIQRNTPIPVQAEQTFTTQQDEQTAISFHIIQGESKIANNCRSLAKFDIKGLDKKPAGTHHIIISFSLDSDGLLHIEAKDKNTNIYHKLDIMPSYNLIEKDIVSLL